MKYRKKPVVIEAIQWTGDNWDVLSNWCAYGLTYEYPSREKKISIKTLEGTMIADLNDWIIKGIKGEFYPCKPDIFEATYEKL